ncbi:hypothetical protein DY000_02014917 [Brassica cretica]|uniref:Aminotransferase-like plant mobile domain-containing protein n=1 Tax=Brassica cretica TaxID=69181 RepID=A0ABQ7CNK5_BRACR|nr:hypothetical protein DY000_02014917 [Brassica cretica]
MNPEPLSFLSSLVGGRARSSLPFTDPFSSPVPSWGNVLEADSEAVPMAPLRRLRSCFFDDGSHSEVREQDLANIRRKYLIRPSVGMRSPTEFERAPDGGVGEVAVYEAYLEAGFRGAIPSLIGEVSSFFGFSPSQLTPLTWRTLMALQVLGELHGFSIGVHEILYSYYFAPLANKDGRYVFVKIPEPLGYPTSWRTVDVSRPVSFAGEAVARLVMGIPRRFRWVTFLVSMEALRHSRVWGNAVRSPVSVIYDEHQKVKTWKRRLSYIPPPRLARAALSAGGLSSISSTSVDIMPNRDLLQVRASARWELMREWLEKRVDHWNPEEEYRCHLFLSGGFGRQSENLSQAATPRSDLGIIGEGGARAPLGSLDCILGPGRPRQTTRSFIWDPEVPSLGPGTETGAWGRYPEIVSGPWCTRTLRSCGNPEAFEAVLEPGGLDPEIVVWNPEEPGGSSLDHEISDWNPEAIGEPGGSSLDFTRTVLRLPRQDYYRKSLTSLKGAGVGVVTQVPGLRCFPRLEKQDIYCSLCFTGPRCALGCTRVLGSSDSILRLAHTHSCFVSHTRFDSLWACHCGRATFVRVGQDRRSLET